MCRAKRNSASLRACAVAFRIVSSNWGISLHTSSSNEANGATLCLPTNAKVIKAQREESRKAGAAVKGEAKQSGVPKVGETGKGLEGFGEMVFVDRFGQGFVDFGGVTFVIGLSCASLLWRASGRRHEGRGIWWAR